MFGKSKNSEREEQAAAAAAAAANEAQNLGPNSSNSTVKGSLAISKQALTAEHDNQSQDFAR